MVWAVVSIGHPLCASTLLGVGVHSSPPPCSLEVRNGAPHASGVGGTRAEVSLSLRCLES